MKRFLHRLPVRTDCQYVQLAKDLGVPLVTHDEEVLGAFPEVATRAEAFLES